MHSPRPLLLTLGALLLGAVPPLHGQIRLDMRVLAFADTAGVRFEADVPHGSALVGVPVRATIARADDGEVLWSGELGRLGAAEGDAARLVARVDGVRPRLWSPQTPHLYHAALETVGAGPRAADSIRFGFRSVGAANGRILLNGQPVFLRGNAINPPGRNLPDSLSENPRFAADYLRYLKGIGVNIIRLTEPSRSWFDAADEQGMMIFQGNYGTPRGGKPTAPPEDLAESIRWYREEVLAPQINHPSIIIYALSNEQAAPEINYLSTGHAEVARFLQQVYDNLRRWDETRLYIGNAGYGFGRGGEICDLHRYWGWYYNSFLSFYTLRDPRICWRSDQVQPITLTENTGNYTGPDGRFNLVSNTKQPDSQLNWTGHAPEAEQGPRALAYQAWMAGQAIEITRRLRARNPYLAGLSPFTIAFSSWHGITRFEEMGPKPVLAQYARSYQPVLLSWESWAPQVYAGSTLRPVAHVVNDSDSGETLRGATLHYGVAGEDGQVYGAGTLAFGEVPHYGAVSRTVEIVLPASLVSGSYLLSGSLVRGADTISRNEARVYVASPLAAEGVVTGRRVRLYDPRGKTAQALRGLRVAFAQVADLRGLNPGRDALVVGSAAWDGALTADTAALRSFVERGGRMLILDPSPGTFAPSWFRGGVQPQTAALDHPDVFPGGRPFANGMAVNPERPGHPVWEGITRDHLFLWSDYTQWNEASPGFPAVYPVTRGFALTRPEEISHTAVLANYDHGLQGVALAEFFIGRGSVVLSGFDLVNRAGLDPVADRLLLNLVRYTSSTAAHQPHPLIDGKITWGDYASERGLLTGIHSGLLLHTVPRVPEGLREKYPIRVDDQGFVFAGGQGGWNTKPAVQYVGRGRRVFGPYTFSVGGSVRLPEPAAPVGEGRVWMRVPPGRTVMTTTLENPTDLPLEMEISVNGDARLHRIAAGGAQRVEASLRPGETSLALVFRGDRRLVLLETDFR